MHAHRFRPLLSRRNFAAVTALLLLSLVLVYGFATSRAQSETKGEREFLDKIPSQLPIKVKVKNQEKVKDLTNDQWLGDLEIEVKNVGDKPIYFLRLMLVFVDVKKDSGDEIGYSLVYGRGQLIDIDNRPEPSDVPILPGGTQVFKLHESYVKGWNWYRTKVEKKTHPKKVEIIFSALNFGDGTGFAVSDGKPIPEKRSSIRDDRNGGQSTGPPAADPGRPPEPRFQQASFLMPAGYSPVFFLAAGNTKLSGVLLPTQSCCSGPACDRMKLAFGGNCSCPPPPEVPEPSFHVEFDGFQCRGSGFSCTTQRYEQSECGEGETYHTCTQVFLDPCGGPAETPTPNPTPTPPPTATPHRPPTTGPMQGRAAPTAPITTARTAASITTPAHRRSAVRRPTRRGFTTA